MYAQYGSMITALDTFLTNADISDADFGDVVGRDRSMISKIRRGRLKPTLDLAAAIERATGGVVAMHCWVEDPPPTDIDTTRTVLCVTCNKRSDDIRIRACTFEDCPHAEREAA
jgi:transcriptional regulator with XRE-family HTH domain